MVFSKENPRDSSSHSHRCITRLYILYCAREVFNNQRHCFVNLAVKFSEMLLWFLNKICQKSCIWVLKSQLFLKYWFEIVRTNIKIWHKKCWRHISTFCKLLSNSQETALKIWKRILEMCLRIKFCIHLWVRTLNFLKRQKSL
jgi:hypothetical protein